MNMSIARVGRRSTRTLSVAAAAVATAALLAACSGGSDDDASSAPSSSESATDSSSAAAVSGDVQVVDQTNLLLVTAQETLEARGLEVLVADASGQGREIADPTQWVVVTQDPQSGTVEAGTEVTITARMTTDPIS
jgi:hypothetical protein